jgi:hypothetical protein
MKHKIRFLPLIDELPTGCMATDTPAPLRVIVEVELYPYIDGKQVTDSGGRAVKISCHPRIFRDIVREDKLKQYVESLLTNMSKFETIGRDELPTNAQVIKLGDNSGIGIGEIAIIDPTTPCNIDLKSAGTIFHNAEENRRANYDVIYSKPNDFNFQHKPVVVIVGGGPSVKYVTGNPAFRQLIADKEHVAVVTMSESQNFISGDYYIAAEGSPAGPNRLSDGCDTSSTVLIACSKSHPGYYKRGFKATRWYTHQSDGPERCERFWSHRHAMYDAIQFAARYLKPQHMVFVGIDGAAPLDTLRYHDSDTAPIAINKAVITAGINQEPCILEEAMRHLTTSVESSAWLLRRRNINCWNISGRGVACRSFIVVNPETFLEYHKGHRS